MMANNSNAQWQIDGEVAAIADGRLAASIDLKHPANGLTKLTYDGNAVNGCIPLQVSPEPPAPKSGETLIESYIRGRDLIATYAQTPQRSVQPTYYWHCLECEGSAVGVELMVSMQTSLLDSDPTLSAFSECKGSAHWVCDGKATAIEDATWESPANATGLFLFRLNDEVSYAEMVFPSDFLGASVKKDNGAWQLTYRMFPEDLEKGVIRRGRIRALLMPTKDDIDTATKAYEALSAADPPLTT